MTTEASLANRLDAVLETVAAAAQRSGRQGSDVRLVAVSKTVDAEIVRRAYAAGQRLFGESRVQELADKTAVLPNDIQWHFIGHVQSNKVRAAVRNAAWIHSVDSVKLLNRMDRIAADEGRRPVILLEVNLTGETSKFGVEQEAARQLAGRALQCKHLDFRGFMTMAPFGAPPDRLHRVFASLRKLRDRLANDLHTDLPELSMGMSADYEAAVEEGATLVRVGSAIFGARRAPA